VKGSALTFQEADNNFTNLNTAKLESLSDDTTPSLGGDLDLNGNNITDSTGNPKLGGFEYPKQQPSSTLNGTVTAIDDQRQPNTISLSDTTGIMFNTRIQFQGSDVVAAGLVENQDYFIAAGPFGNNDFEISDQLNGSSIAITNPGTISNFTYTAFIESVQGPFVGNLLGWDGSKIIFQPSGPIINNLNDLTDVNITGGVPADGQILVYLQNSNQWENQNPSFLGLLSSVSEDTNPSLGGNLNVSGQSIVSASNGDIVIAPNGTGKTVTNRLNYSEAVHSLGTTSGTITPNAVNGNVQTITLNGNLTLNAFTSPVAGQSITLIVNTGGTGRTLSSTMKWAGGEKTLSTTNTTDIISVFYDGANYWASLSKDFK
jgi:hypothetical protein